MGRTISYSTRMSSRAGEEPDWLECEKQSADITRSLEFVARDTLPTMTGYKTERLMNEVPLICEEAIAAMLSALDNLDIFPSSSQKPSRAAASSPSRVPAGCARTSRHRRRFAVRDILPVERSSTQCDEF